MKRFSENGKWDLCAGKSELTGQKKMGGIFTMGLFSGKKKEEEKPEEITPDLRAKLDEFAERGN